MKLSSAILSAVAALVASDQQPGQQWRFEHQSQQLAQLSSSKLSTEYFLLPTTGPQSTQGHSAYESPSPPPSSIGGGHQRPAEVIVRKPVSAIWLNGMLSNQQPILKQQPWALPLAAFSVFAMLLMAGFEIFVLFKVNFFFLHICN